MIEVFALMLLSHQPLQPVAQGVASYYTVESSSALTASGERLDDGAYTCAMRQGEFGDYFLVVAENGKSVVCKLNDRGPYVNGRVIDLSKAAIRRLTTTSGTIHVTVFPLGKAVPAPLVAKT
jgi:rare lipoprotein A